MSDFIVKMQGGDRKKWIEFLENTKAYYSKVKTSPKRELSPFIRTPLYQPYIPGSSIKGAMRTAIMYIILKRMSEEERDRILNSFVRREIEKIKSNQQRRGKYFIRNREKMFSKDLEMTIFQKFYIDSNQTKFDPHSDVLRAIKVSDSKPLPPDSAVVEEVHVYTRGRPTGIQIFVETVPTGTELEFNISVNYQLLQQSYNYTKSLSINFPRDEIFEIIRNPINALTEWTHDLLEYERRVAKNTVGNSLIYYFDTEPNIHLGWGGGLLATTVDLLLPDKLRADLLALFKNRRPYLPVPASRRITAERKPLGWGRITN